jgi:hypothetical protein
MDGGEYGSVYAFLHMGDGNQPHAGVNSNYYRVWVMANGGRPRKRQRMSHRMFVGKIFEVRIDDVNKTFTGQSRDSYSTYSVVKEFISCIERH